MGELKKLVEEGKLYYVGLSEDSALARRVHAVHPWRSWSGLRGRRLFCMLNLGGADQLEWISRLAANRHALRASSGIVRVRWSGDDAQGHCVSSSHMWEGTFGFPDHLSKSWCR